MQNFDAWLDQMTRSVREKIAPAPLHWDVDGPCPECRHTHVEIKQDSCYCAVTHAPCSNCENSWLECPECRETNHHEINN